MGKAASARLILLLAAFSWCALGWTQGARLFPDAYPPELPGSVFAGLAAGCVVFGAGVFAAAGAPGGAAAGAIHGLSAAVAGSFASRWPLLARAIELCGGTFLGLALSVLLLPVLAATHALTAAALTRADWRPFARRLVFAAIAAWGAATIGAEAALSRWWGFGPRSLAEAAGVPTNAEAERLAVAWLYPARGRSWRAEPLRMSSTTTDLSARSLERLESFLENARFRGVFAAEALEAVRLGRVQWWDEERALDALMLSFPGRAHPDYRKALELIRAGQLSAERFGKLEQLSAATGRRVEGFEKPGEAQLIFEGFSAAYARFGDEAKAREWLERLDGLWAVSDKRIEAGPVEDLRDGRVEGSVFLDAAPAATLRVGLFLVWRSSATRTTHYWLSGSRAPDADGRFLFDNLGPGRYALALLGPPEAFRGTILGAPGYFEVTYERPEVLLDPVRVAPGMTVPPPDLAPDPPARSSEAGSREPPLPPRR